MGGAFNASELFDFDPEATAAEIQRQGAEALRWLVGLAAGNPPPPIDIHLIRSIHDRWFRSTFPTQCGQERKVVVLNTKGTAVDWKAVVPAMYNACDNWNYRFETVVSVASGEDQVELLVSEANTLAVRLYDLHPFIDGNTRTTFHLRNYALMLGGMSPLLGLHDDEAHKRAWVEATPHDHEALDEIVLETLMEQGI